MSLRHSDDRFISGDWNSICDICGWKYKASKLRKGIGRQKGLRVCQYDWDEDHPQDHLRSVEDDSSVPWSRPEPTDIFVEDFCEPTGIQAVVGYAVVGCAVIGLDADVASEDPIPSGTFDSNNGTL